MANVLTTKTDVKIWLEDTAATSSFDALLDAIILAVSQRIEKATNRKLFRATYVELVDGGAARFFVRNPPIVSITSIIYIPTFDITNGVTLGTSEYTIDPSDRKNSVYSTFGKFLDGDQSHQVTYIGGYISADSVPDEDADPPVLASNIPDDLRSAATQQVVYTFKQRKSVGLDNIQMPDGVIHKTTQHALIAEVMDVVKQYRVRNIY